MGDRYRSTFTSYQNTIVPRSSQTISMETSIRNINLSLASAAKATYHRRSYCIYLNGLQVVRLIENVCAHCCHILWNLKILHTWKIRKGIITYISECLWQTDVCKFLLTIMIFQIDTNHSISLAIFSNGRRYHQRGNISTPSKSSKLSQAIGIIQTIT